MGIGGFRKRRTWWMGLRTATSILLTATPTLAGDAKRGEPMFQRYCSGCHGVDGRGGGKNFMPHVGALMRPGYTELLDDDYMARIITDGGEVYGKSAFMPAFKRALSPQDIADVIAYVRTFPLR
jgi:cytochrome c oxidase cbb3-type subunit 3